MGEIQIDLGDRGGFYDSLHTSPKVQAMEEITENMDFNRTQTFCL